MKKIINLYKKLGMTPLEAIEKLKDRNINYKSKKISYPGRLDPMAEGVLILLVGDENKKMQNYMKLDKEYLAEFLLGFSTDSFDVLGIVSSESKDSEASKFVDDRELKKKIKGFKGDYLQEIPVYSSYKIKGKPMFYYARNDKLDKIKIPRTNVKIKDVKIKDIYEISSSRLLKEIKRKIGLVKGDFRQKEIVEKWKELLDKDEKRYKIVKVLISCSSGTYIRAIANDLGKDFGGGVLFSLKRTRVGKFDVRDSERI